MIRFVGDQERKGIEVNPQTFDVGNALPFPNNYLDAVCSHMFFNIKFSQEELSYIISIIGRVLKDRGFNSFFVRNVQVEYNKKG